MILIVTEKHSDSGRHPSSERSDALSESHVSPNQTRASFLFMLRDNSFCGLIDELTNLVSRKCQPS